MKNIEKYQSLLASGEVDALLLTSEYNRLYAAQYGVAEGVAVVTKEGAYYFTDSRYIEAAENNLPGFTVRMTHPGSSEVERINEVIGEHTIKKLGFEELDMSYATFLEFQHALHAVLVPMQKKIDAFRASKEPWELELMRKAQEITDLTFTQLQKVICAGMTEKDLRAELIAVLQKLRRDHKVARRKNRREPCAVGNRLQARLDICRRRVAEGKNGGKLAVDG